MLLRAIAVLVLSLPVCSFACESKGSTSPDTESVESMLARTVFNRVTGATVDTDAALMSAYGCRYIFANVADTPALTRPIPIAGGLPPTPTDSEGRRIVGYVLIGFIVSSDGRAVDPIVLKTSDARLTNAALEAMREWRFEPAQFNGKTVATLAAQEFEFKGNTPDA